MEIDDGISVPIDSITLSRQYPYRLLDEYFDRHGILQGRDGGAYVLCSLSPIIRGLLSDYHLEVMDDRLMREHPWRLACNLLRWITHYRHYLHSRYRWRSILFLYYNTVPCPWKTCVLPDYKAKIHAKINDPPPKAVMMVEYIKKNLDLVRSILEVVPRAYLIDTGDLDCEAFPEVVRRRGKPHHPVIVLSGSINDLQLVERQAVDRKDGGSIYTFTATSKSSSLFIGAEESFREMMGIPGGLCIYMSLAGEGSLGVSGWRGHAKKRVSRWITHNAGSLNFKSQTLDEILPLLPQELGVLQDVRKAWACLNHREYVSRFFTEKHYHQMRAQMINTPHGLVLEQVENEYFPHYQIDIDRIMAGG